MLKFLHTCLKWAVAGNELQALDRYRTATLQAEQWLAAFPAAADAARYVHDMGEGRSTADLPDVRAKIDARETQRMLRLADGIRENPIPKRPRHFNPMQEALDDLGAHIESWPVLTGSAWVHCTDRYLTGDCPICGGGPCRGGA